MNKFLKKMSLFFLVLSMPAFAWQNVTSDIPEIEHSKVEFLDRIDKGVIDLEYNGVQFRKYENAAQYKDGDWSHVVGIARGIYLDRALKIAASNPEITYFFHVKGLQMCLETKKGEYRVFHRGDAVFFSGKPCLTYAPDLSDGYVKKD